MRANSQLCLSNLGRGSRQAKPAEPLSMDWHLPGSFVFPLLRDRPVMTAGEARVIVPHNLSNIGPLHRNTSGWRWGRLTNTQNTHPKRTNASLLQQFPELTACSSADALIAVSNDVHCNAVVRGSSIV